MNNYFLPKNELEQQFATSSLYFCLCLPSLRMYTALLVEGQGMLRVQALSLQAESQGQHRDARQSTWAQELQSYMGTAS